MGTWLNVAFIQCADTAQVEPELSRLLVEAGRRLITPRPRTPERYDRMQDLVRWLGQLGAGIDPESQEWRVHPAHIVRRLAQAGSASLSPDQCVEPALKTVFGGPNAQHCDNLFLVETLVPHAPMPVDGFVLYAEANNS